jgi:hypothetical protein
MRENLTSGSTGGSWKRNTLTTGTQKNDPAGNRKVHHGYAPYRQVTSPRQLPTQPTSPYRGNRDDLGRRLALTESRNTSSGYADGP